MTDLNSVVLVGHLTRDIDLKYTNNGMAIADFSLAVDRNKEETDFIRCKTFGKTAENIANFFKKGDLIAVNGSIQTGKYTNKEQRTIYTTDVVVDTFAFLQSKNERQFQSPQVENEINQLAQDLNSKDRQHFQQVAQQSQQNQAQRTVGINPVITPEQAYDQNTQF